MMGGDSGGSAGAGGGSTVAIVDFAFQPMATFVGVGETVTWSNTGAAPHTVSADSGAFDSSTIDPGGAFSQTFDTAGTYGYHCNIHPNMRGMVVVSAPFESKSSTSGLPAPAPRSTFVTAVSSTEPYTFHCPAVAVLTK